MNNLQIPPGLTGGEGVILAVIAVAVKDALGNDEEQRKSALDYFSGPLYRLHLRLLGLSETDLPIDLQETI